MTDQTASTSKRRGQAIAGVLTAVLVIAVLTAVFFIVRSGKDEPAAGPAPATQQAQAASPSAPAPVASADAAAPAPPGALSQEPEVKAGSGTLSKMVIKELIPGTGPAVKSGQTITVNYKLVSFKTGKLVDSSWTRGEPFSTQIGTGQLIKGWDQGIPGQKVGSRVQLDVPAALAYGAEQGDLRFVVDILDAK